MSETGVVTAVRPNGKPYRRRLGPVVEAEFDNDWSAVETVAVVLRTHDVDEAVAMLWAFDHWRYDRPDALPPPRLRWVRKSVCMCGGDHGWDMVEDVDRGVPAVEFARVSS